MDIKVLKRADILVNSLRLDFANLQARKELKLGQVLIFKHNLKVILQFIDNLSQGDLKTRQALHLLTAIQAAFSVGVFGEIDPAHESELWSMANAAKTESATAWRKAKAAPQIQNRREIIRKHYRTKLADSATSARAVIKKCESIFKAQGINAYSVETIRNDIRAILVREK